MAAEKEVGLVIKMMDFEDYDKIVTILTSDSLVSFIALGVRKLESKNRVALQLGNLVEVELFKARLTNKLSKLKTATLLKQPPLKEADTATVWLEIIKYLQKMRRGSEKVFKSILEAYSYFGEEFNHIAKTYIVFRLLDEMGQYPNMEQCVDCTRKDRIVDFDLERGGFLCALHSEHKLPLTELEAWHALGKNFNDYLKVDPKVNKEIYIKVINYISNYSY